MEGDFLLGRSGFELGLAQHYALVLTNLRRDFLEQID